MTKSKARSTHEKRRGHEAHKSPGHQPLRRCALTRQAMEKDQLIRFVAGPEGFIVPDLKARLPGRGVWIAAQKDHIMRAESQNVFARALGRSVRIEAGLADRIDSLIKARALNAFNLARKAGSFITGFTKVQHALLKGQAQALIIARGAAENNLHKLEKIISNAYKQPERFPVFDFFTCEELDLAFARTNVIYAALIGNNKSMGNRNKHSQFPEPYAGGFLTWAFKLQFYRKGEGKHQH